MPWHFGFGVTFLEYVLRQKVGFLASDHQDRNVDSVPVFPEVHAVVPGIAERVRNIRVTQRLVSLPLRLPFHAIDRQMTPMLIFQFSERRQNATKIQFGCWDSFEALRSLIEVGTETKQSGPRKIRSNIVDHYAADRAARQRGQTMPIKPPKEVPTQSISTGPNAAIKAVMSLQYCGNT